MNKKGFTLIELLAVILILGIISLIAIPVINETIVETRKGALRESARNIEKAVGDSCLVDQMHGGTGELTFVIENKIVPEGLEIKGVPESGVITSDSSCNVSVEICDNGYCASNASGNVVVTSNTNNPIVVPTQDESCFIFDEATNTITGYNINKSGCSKNISIPATINDVPVLHIGDYAFYNAEGTTFYLGYKYGAFYTDIVKENITKSGATLVYEAKVKDIDTYTKRCYKSPNYVDESINYEMNEQDGYDTCNIAGLPTLPSTYEIESLDLSHATNLITIGEGAFMGNKITSINFGTISNLTTIKNSAFQFNLIHDLNLVDSITSLGLSSFYGNDIENLKLPNRLATIPMVAFQSNKVVNVTWPTEDFIIDMGAFTNNSFISLDLPDNLTRINFLAFYYNQNLTSVSIPDDVKVADEAFTDCPNISSLTIGNRVELDNYAFANNYPNTQLVTLSIGSGVTSPAGYGFAYMSGIIDTVSYPSSTFTTIPANLFNSTKVNNLVVGTDTTVIGEGAFYNSEVKNVTWNEKLIRIEQNSFYRNNLSVINIPNKVTSVQTKAFNTCLNSNIVLTIPDSVLYLSYKEIFKDCNFSSVSIGSGIVSIKNDAFSCKNKAKCSYTININKPADSIANAPWGNSYATINWVG